MVSETHTIHDWVELLTGRPLTLMEMQEMRLADLALYVLCGLLGDAAAWTGPLSNQRLIRPFTEEAQRFAPELTRGLADEIRHYMIEKKWLLVDQGVYVNWQEVRPEVDAILLGVYQQAMSQHHAY